MTTTLIIPEKVPSNNGKNGLLRTHWAKRRKLVETWAWLFRAQTTNRHAGQVEIQIIHYHIGRAIQDYDNLVSTLKLPLDALVKAGIIADDKMSVIGVPTIEQVRVKDKKEVKTVITIISKQ